MKPSPHPSASCLWPLNPATSHNNNNNNSGGLHACVCAAEDIEPFLQLTRLVVKCVSRSSSSTSLPVHTKDSSSCCVWFLHLLSVCLQCASLMHVLMSSATYRPGIWTTAFSVMLSGSVWMQVFLKRWQGRWRRKISFSPVWTGPQSCCNVSFAQNRDIAARVSNQTIRSHQGITKIVSTPSGSSFVRSPCQNESVRFISFCFVSFRLIREVAGCCRFPLRGFGAYWGQIQFTQWA